MKILVAGDFSWEIYEKPLVDAFDRLGEDTYSFEWKEYNYKDENCICKLLDSIQTRLVFGPKILKINRRLIAYIKDISPDLVFIYRGIPIYSKTIVEIKKTGVKVFSYHNDDTFSGVPSKSFYRYYKKSVKECDYNFVYRKKNINDLRNIGVENAAILMPYYIPKLNYPIDCDKPYDITFMGHFENDGRDKYIKALKDAGLKIIVFDASYWKNSEYNEEFKSIIKPAERGLKYNELLNKTKIALVFLSKINNDTYTRRCFEIPATKTLMMCEYTDDMASMFEADKEAVYFKTSEELVSKCTMLLNNPTRLKEIAENGYNKVMSARHSIDDRAKEIINVYEQQRSIY